MTWLNPSRPASASAYAGASTSLERTRDHSWRAGSVTWLRTCPIGASVTGSGMSGGGSALPGGRPNHRRSIEGPFWGASAFVLKGDRFRKTALERMQERGEPVDTVEVRVGTRSLIGVRFWGAGQGCADVGHLGRVQAERGA